MSLFITKDLNFGAFLWCLPNVSVSKLELEGGSRGGTIYFTFDTPYTEIDMVNLKMDYYNGKVQVNPLNFSQRQEDLKDLMFAHMGIEVRTKRSR